MAWEPLYKILQIFLFRPGICTTGAGRSAYGSFARRLRSLAHTLLVHAPGQQIPRMPPPPPPERQRKVFQATAVDPTTHLAVSLRALRLFIATDSMPLRPYFLPLKQHVA